MIAAALLVAQLFVPDPETSGEAPEQHVRSAAAKNCVAAKAAEYARHTAETAEAIARYAVRQCGKDIAAISPAGRPQDAAGALIPMAALWVMEWRVRVSKRGPSEWEVIGSEIRPLE